jgi:hypothetical protein
MQPEFPDSERVTDAVTKLGFGSLEWFSPEVAARLSRAQPSDQPDRGRSEGRAVGVNQGRWREEYVGIVDAFCVLSARADIAESRRVSCPRYF